MDPFHGGPLILDDSPTFGRAHQAQIIAIDMMNRTGLTFK
jgi:hypothetical protein